MKRILMTAAAISLLIVVLTAGLLSTRQHSTAAEKKANLYTYPIAVKDKTYIVTLQTNWTTQKTPTISLSDSSLTPYALILYFLGGSKATITYNVTIPTELLSGDISLIWKYYVQNPDRYVLINNGTHNTLQMTFSYDPYFSGNGYFEILGTEGDW
jgi:hypothetical protein